MRKRGGEGGGERESEAERGKKGVVKGVYNLHGEAFRMYWKCQTI